MNVKNISITYANKKNFEDVHDFFGCILKLNSICGYACLILKNQLKFKEASLEMTSHYDFSIDFKTMMKGKN